MNIVSSGSDECHLAVAALDIVSVGSGIRWMSTVSVGSGIRWMSTVNGLKTKILNKIRKGLCRPTVVIVIPILN